MEAQFAGPVSEEKVLRNTVVTLLMDEFEVVCWIDYVEQLNLIDMNYDINDAHRLFETAI